MVFILPLVRTVASLIPLFRSDLATSRSDKPRCGKEVAELALASGGTYTALP